MKVNKEFRETLFRGTLLCFQRKLLGSSSRMDWRLGRAADILLHVETGRRENHHVEDRAGPTA